MKRDTKQGGARMGSVSSWIKAHTSKRDNSLITFAVVVVAFAVMQILKLAGGLSSTLTGMLVPICAYVMMAISLNLCVGVLGELSLGHAGFMSVGAFAGVTVAVSLEGAVASDGLRLLIAILAGTVLAAVMGFLIGIPVLRLNGDYLAIVTLAFGEIIKVLINNLYIGQDANGLHASFINNTMKLADTGRIIIGGPMGAMNTKSISTFFAGFLLVIIGLVVVFNFMKSEPGRSVMAIRDNTIAAQSIGVNITRYKMIAFTLSAALAGGAGALFGLNFSTVVANKFDFNTSILVLVFVVLGGLGNMLGSVIAAAALTVLPELHAMRGLQNYRMLVYAIILIVVMIARNNETVHAVLSNFINRIYGFFKIRKMKKEGAANE